MRTDMAAWGTRLSAALAWGRAHWRQLAVVALLAFGLGALFGWLVRGWRPAAPAGGVVSPADLDPQWRALYVQTAADAFARENDLARARLRLQGFDDAQLRAILSDLANDQAASEVSRGSVTALANALSLAIGATAAPGLTAAVTAPAASATSGTSAAPEGESAPGAARWLVLLLAGALLFALGLWFWRAGRHGHGETGGAPRAVGGAESDDFSGPRAPDRGRSSAPPWRPDRLYLGDTITTRCRAGEEPFYQSYLVHNERGVLIGSISMQSQRVGSVTTVNVWLVERDDEGLDGETPLITFAAPAAAEDNVFRARLSDRRVVAALPGERVLLTSAHLVVDIRVRAVQPGPDSDALSLEALTLSLTPDTTPPAGDVPSAAVDVEPPVPFPFRTD